MNRRGFMGAILAACAAPALVKASSIMRVRPDGLWVPDQNGVFTCAGLLIADDSLADAMAEGIVRNGQIGTLDRFTMYTSRAEYPRAFLDRKIVTSEELRWAARVKPYFEPPRPATARVRIRRPEKMIVSPSFVELLRKA
jgi:hypothetical protein